MQVPARSIVLDISARAKRQEMIFGPIKYWEGPTAVAGSMNGRRVRGAGFMELVGYYESSKMEDFLARTLSKTIG